MELTLVLCAAVLLVYILLWLTLRRTRRPKVYSVLVFDLSPIPAGAIITDVVLRVDCSIAELESEFRPRLSMWTHTKRKRP